LPLTQFLSEEKPTTNILPFSFERKRMSTIHSLNEDVLIYTKGAPRNIIDLCSKVLVDNKVEELNQKNLDIIEKRVLEFANEGLRVIAVAYKQLPKTKYNKDDVVENDLVFVGLAGMRDPPRTEVKSAVLKAKEAGIKTVIITGDYGPTAQVIAQEVGVAEEDSCRIVRGVDLEELSDSGIVDEVKNGTVIFARVSPEQKLRIVKVLKASGAVVAVTGDGANDAPSLKEANIGIAMGVSGTDVAREAADIVLLNDSFASIVRAVESGRAIYENIRKFVVFVFAHNWAQLVPYVLYAALAIPLPLLVVQVLAIDLAIDVVPSLALSREPPEAGIMQEPPRSIKERMFTRGVFLRSLYIGLIIGGGAMFACVSTWIAGGWQFGTPLATNDPVYIKGVTMTFAGIVLGQVGNVIACRTNKQSSFKISIARNKWIIMGMAAQVLILSLLIYVPPMQGLFGTTALGITDWLYLLSITFAVISIEEVRKFFTRRMNKKSEDLSKHDHI